MLPVAKLGSRKLHLALALAIGTVYLVLSIGTALTKLPFCDEGWYADPAFNLSRGRSMGTPVVESAGTWLKGLDQYTYWVMPLYIMVQAGLYKVFGFGLLQMRVLSTAWGLVLLASWFLIMRALFEERILTLLTCTLIALDFHFVVIGSVGRTDMMCAALGSAALAAYLCLRERDFALAISVSHTFVVASGLTHPNGILYLAGLLYLTFYFDRKRIAWRHLGIAAVPYLIGVVGWGSYIVKNPSDFFAQFGAHASHRLWGLSSPWAALKAEISKRYLGSYGFGSRSSALSRLQIFVLLAYMTGLVGAVLSRGIRQHTQSRLLLRLTAIFFSIMVIFEGAKQHWYLVHIIPLFAAALAVWVRCCWKRQILPTWLIIVGLCGVILLDLGGVAYLIRRNLYQTRYMAAVRFLKSGANGHSLVMGGAELGFQLSFDNVIDDYRLGYYSRTRPKFIVVEEIYRGWFQKFRSSEPDVYRHVDRTLREDYQKVYDDGLYQIYLLQETALP